MSERDLEYISQQDWRLRLNLNEFGNDFIKL